MTNENKKTFFETLPGILTGIAALLAALTTLYLTFHKNISNPEGQNIRTDSTINVKGIPDSHVNTVTNRVEPEAPPEVSLERTKYYLPGEGKKNNNSSIGDFCCTGETVTVRSKNGYPLGYIYYYDFRGGMNISTTQSVASQFSILVSGLSNPSDSKSNHIKQSLDFTSDELYKGAIKSIQAGSLNFKVTILNVSKYSDINYYEMGTVSSKVDVSIVKD